MYCISDYLLLPLLSCREMNLLGYISLYLGGDGLCMILYCVYVSYRRALFSLESLDYLPGKCITRNEYRDVV